MDIQTQLTLLDETVAHFAAIFQDGIDPEMMVYEEWNAKDVLGHLVFWHESFARNVSDLVHDIKPTPLKGTFSVLNQRCMEEMRPYTVDDLLQRLQVAHSTIQLHIFDPKLKLIPYRKGSRDYSPEEHLDIVNDHIKAHMRDILRKRSSN